MHRKNTWVFYFFIILFAVLITINLVWRFSPIKSQIQESLEKRLKPYLGESFKIKDYSLGFGYISLYDLSASGDNQNYTVYLQEVQIGYSIHKLFLHKFDPLKVIESISFKEPRLILRTNHHAQEQKKDSDSALDFSDIISGFQKFAEIDRILVEDGQILWERNGEKPEEMTSETDGFLFLNSDSQLVVDLKGTILGSRDRSLSLKGSINFVEKRWDLTAHIDEAHLPNGLPFLNRDHFHIEQADVNGVLQLHCPSFYLRELQISGNLDVQNMQMYLFKQSFKTNPFQLIFDGQDMRLSPVSGWAEDGRFVLSGNLGKLFRPGIYLSVDFEDYSVVNLFKSVSILELLNKGKLQGHIDLNGIPSELVIKGAIYSSVLHYTFVPLYRSSLQFIYNNKTKLWNFQEIKAHSVGMDHEGTGFIDFGANRLHLDIWSHRNIEAGTFHILDRLNRTRMIYHTLMEGDFPTLTFTGDINAGFTSGQDTVLSARARYKLVKDHIRIDSYKSFPQNIKFSTEISDLWHDPNLDILEMTNVPFHSLSTLESVKWLSKKFQSNFYFSGPINFPTGKANFVSRSTENLIASLQGSAINLIKPGFKFRGNFSFQTTPSRIRGKVSLTDRTDHLEIGLNAPGVAQGSIRIGYGNNALFSGNIDLEKIPITKYLTSSVFRNALSEGELTGKVRLSGTNGSPQIDFALSADNFIINENGYYSASFEGLYKDQVLRFEKARINLNNVPVFDARFHWNSATDRVNAHFKGEKIESNFLATTFLKDPNLIRGSMQYELAMNGPLARPKISGTLDIKNGIVLKRPFEQMTINFEDSIPARSNLLGFEDHVLKIGKMIFVNKKEYTIEGQGQMAVSPTGPLDLHLKATGNVLIEIPNILSYFQDPDCVGELRVHLTGSRENPALTAGHLNIYNGSLHFASVIPPVKELKAEIDLPEGAQRINIKSIQGKIGNHEVRIYNTFSPSGAASGLQPWYFEDLGLNFGEIVMETDPRGIPLSIPGLMNPGDIGYFAVSGKNDDEAFYFAGPVDHPHVRGKVTLFDSRVTFPFLETEESQSEGENKVVDFLMNTDWDVLAVSGLSNRYFVDIPAVIGQVYLDLNIDNVSKGLNFTGKISDESFRVEGGIESTRGRVEYLDVNFRVERFGAIFNRFELFPQVYGRAYTTVRDSTNFPKDIYLELYAIDPETKEEVSRGRWEDFRFKLVSSSPTIGETQEQVLSYLGYSLDNIQSKAGAVGLTLTENYLIRPLVRPLERKLERGLHLDYVRLRSNITSNLINYSLQNRVKFLRQPEYFQNTLNNNFDPALLLLQSSEVTLGKYIWKDIYLTYSGQLVSVYDESKVGFNHHFGVEYRLFRNLLLELEYDNFLINPEFYNQNALNDFRIRFRHSFNF